MDTPATQSAAFTSLLQDFVEMRISPHEFETRFVELLNENPGSLDPRVTKPLHFLFCEVDNFAYQNMQDPHDSNEIDEHNLRTSAREALRELLRLPNGRGHIEE